MPKDYIPDKLRFGEVIKKYHKASGIKTKDLAELLHVTRGTILHWETDINRPSVEQIKALCEILKIPPHELFRVASPDSISDTHEENIINCYRKAGDVGRAIIEKTAVTVYEEEEKGRIEGLRKKYRPIPLEATAAAAGSGNPFFDAGEEYRYVRTTGISKAADTIIRVSGRSMEPKYNDGDLVYVKFANSADDGRDVICSTADGAVIKHKAGNKLVSLNPNLPFGEKSEDDYVKIEGVVLGIVDMDDIAGKEDSAALEEIYKNL